MRRFSFIILVCAMHILIGCGAHKTVTENTIVRRDTVYHRTLQRDSVYYRDSIYTFVKGDTLLVKEYHVKVYDRLAHDTVYRTKYDTVMRVCTNVEYREKEESWWSATLKRIGIASLILLVVAIAVWIIKKTRLWLP